MKKKNGMSHPYELNPAILWSVKVCSCKQALCPDEILSSYYLNLNARSFVKWLGLRSPNRNKFSRVAKHNRKINSSLFCIGRHKLVFFFLIARRHTFWLNRFIFFFPSTSGNCIFLQTISHRLEIQKPKTQDAWKQLSFTQWTFF